MTSLILITALHSNTGHPFEFFDTPGIKNWNDSNTYRLGITHQLNERWSLMAGMAYDETPIQKKYIGFELPDSDAIMFSVGAKHKYTDATHHRWIIALRS